MRKASLVSCTDNYVPYLNAQLNSLDFHKHNHQVHIIAIDVGPWYLEKVRSTEWTFPLFIHERRLEDFEQYRPQGGKNMMAKKARYELLPQFKDYDALLFLDADIFFVNNIDKFFEFVTGTNTILGVNERFKWNLGAYEVGGRRLPDVHMDWMICNAPTFMSPNRNNGLIDKMRMAAGRVIEWKKGRVPSDLFTMNIALYLAGVTEDVVAMPSYLWTGVHCSYFHFYPRIFCRGDGKWQSQTGEKVYAIHGRWNKDGCADSHRRNLIKQYEELGMNEITKNKLLANMEQTLKQIQEQFHFFNTGHKLKLEG